MRKYLIALAALAVAIPLAGCQAPKAPAATQAVHVRSDGTQSRATRSALDGSGDAGRQEILAFYIPPFLGLPGAPDFRAGITVDPSGLQFPIIIPPPTFSTQAVGPCATSQAGPCTTTQTVMVEETYYETETRQVPRKRMVPRTVQVPSVPVPVPATPQAVDPCPPPPIAKVCDEEGCDLPDVPGIAR